jgi:hypothetical protein
VADPVINARLVGPDEDGGRVHFDDFCRFCDKMNLCLRRAEMVVTSQSSRIHYRIDRLQDGSAAFDLAPLRPRKGPDYRAAVVVFFNSTVVAFQRGEPADERLGMEGLREFRSLYSDMKRTKEIWIAGERITSQYLANIDQKLRPAFTSEGFVTGVLERLNVHDKNEFILFPPEWGAVTCVFPEDLFEQVRAAIKRNVTVSGTLAYPPDKPHPVKVHVKEMEVHPPDKDLPTLRQLRGLFRGGTGGKTALEFLKSIRDEQDD